MPYPRFDPNNTARTLEQLLEELNRRDRRTDFPHILRRPGVHYIGTPGEPPFINDWANFTLGGFGDPANLYFTDIGYQFVLVAGIIYAPSGWQASPGGPLVNHIVCNIPPGYEPAKTHANGHRQFDYKVTDASLGPDLRMEWGNPGAFASYPPGTYDGYVFIHMVYPRAWS